MGFSGSRTLATHSVTFAGPVPPLIHNLGQPPLAQQLWMAPLTYRNVSHLNSLLQFSERIMTAIGNLGSIESDEQSVVANKVAS